MEQINPSRPNPWRREKINVNFYFHTFLWYLKRFYKDLKGLHDILWGITRKCENKNFILIQLSEMSGTGRLKYGNMSTKWVQTENLYLNYFRKSNGWKSLTHSWRRSLSYRNQSIDLLWKSVDWFLNVRYLRHGRVNGLFCIPWHMVGFLK